MLEDVIGEIWIIVAIIVLYLARNTLNLFKSKPASPATACKGNHCKDHAQLVDDTNEVRLDVREVKTDVKWIKSNLKGKN